MKIQRILVCLVNIIQTISFRSLKPVFFYLNHFTIASQPQREISEESKLTAWSESEAVREAISENQR